MINNNVGDYLNRFMNNRAAADKGGRAADIFQRLQDRRKAMTAQPMEEEVEAEEAAATPAEEKDTVETRYRNLRGGRGKGKGAEEAAAEDAGKKSGKKSAEADLSPQERRKLELQAILDRINKEEGERRGGAAEKTGEKSNVVTVTDKDGTEKSSGGMLDFLNDMPLFNEFKSGLIDAFKRLDGDTVGGISAQYELNYSSMQYIANAAGDLEYKETTFSVKLDLSYIKASGGSTQGIIDAIEGAKDFSSLVGALSGQADQTQGEGAEGLPSIAEIKPEDFINSLKDYFSPEKTADRIVDFATAFFPLSDQLKNGGDTEEAREEFAKVMRGAIQKGFDQAMGTLGSVPKKVKDDIDKTHELTFKGIEDFVKNGMNRKKEEQGVYDALQKLVFSAEVSYSEKHVTHKSSGYGQSKQTQATPAVNTEA